MAGLNFNNVPHPAFLNRLITTKPEGFGWDNLGPRQPKFIVLHRMIGTLWGTDSYFRQPATGALTDYGVGVAAQDGAANAGVIIRWNDPRGFRSGWASGPVSAPYGDGRALVDTYGVNVVNKDGVSVEISGINYNVPLDPTSQEEIIKLCAYWCDQMKIPYDRMPINPATGISAFVWHQEFTIGTGKLCPGKVVMDWTDDLIEATAALMKTFQVGTTEPPAPAPGPLPPADIDTGRARLPQGMSTQLARRLYGDASEPDGDTAVFDLRHSIASRHWLRRYAAQIAPGATYRDVPWPGLVKVMRRGTGAWLYQWGDGHIYEIDAERVAVEQGTSFLVRR